MTLKLGQIGTKLSAAHDHEHPGTMQTESLYGELEIELCRARGSQAEIALVRGTDVAWNLIRRWRMSVTGRVKRWRR